MKQIPLTQGKFALVDDEDFEELSKFKWYARRKGTHRNIFYAMRSVKVDGKWTTQLMHRLILKGGLVEHEDSNGLNNQRSNLRIATNQENSRNQRGKLGHSSIFKGVSKKGDKFRVQIKFGKVLHLGTFECEIEAALAYNEAAKKYFGNFANLNEV